MDTEPIISPYSSLCSFHSEFWVDVFDRSTAFLIGPKRQFNMMLDPVRIYATALYLASIIMALFCALYVRWKLIILIIDFISTYYCWITAIIDQTPILTYSINFLIRSATSCWHFWLSFWNLVDWYGMSPRSFFSSLFIFLFTNTLLLYL